MSRTVRADRDTIFRAWIDPAALIHWWRLDEEGWAFAGAAIDLRVGGRYRLSMTAPDGKTHTAAGEYRTIDRPSRLSFTWDWEDPTTSVGETLVTIELNEAGNGRTEVVLTHERFKDPSRMGRHKEGWTQLLKRLDDAVG